MERAERCDDSGVAHCRDDRRRPASHLFRQIGPGISGARERFGALALPLFLQRSDGGIACRGQRRCLLLRRVWWWSWRGADLQFRVPTHDQ